MDGVLETEECNWVESEVRRRPPFDLKMLDRARFIFAGLQHHSEFSFPTPRDRVTNFGDLELNGIHIQAFGFANKTKLKGVIHRHRWILFTG